MKNRMVNLNPERACKVREALQHAGLVVRNLEARGLADEELGVLARSVGRACLAFDAARDETRSEEASARTLLDGMRRVRAVLCGTDTEAAVDQAHEILADFIGGAEQVDGVESEAAGYGPGNGPYPLADGVR